MKTKIPNNSDLEKSGYTQSGKDMYNKKIEEYSLHLFEISKKLGEMDKAPTVEITHKHVEAAIRYINKKNIFPKWMWITKAGRHLCAVSVGVATTYLNNLVGVIGFAIAFTMWMILHYIEANVDNYI